MNFKAIVWWQWIVWFLLLIVVYSMGYSSGETAFKNFKYKFEIATILTLLTICDVLFGIASIFIFKNVEYLIMSIICYAFFNGIQGELYK